MDYVNFDRSVIGFNMDGSVSFDDTERNSMVLNDQKGIFQRLEKKDVGERGDCSKVSIM